MFIIGGGKAMPESNTPGLSGPEWRHLVWDEICAIRKDVSFIRTEIAMLKVKAGIWGAIGAAIPVIAMLLYQILT